MVALRDSSTASAASLNRGTVASNSSSNVLFKDVTGETDLSSIALQNLSTAVMQNTASYKERTVIVSLDGKNLVELADGKDVAEYAASPAGQKKDAALREMQDDFLSELDYLGIEYTLKNRYTVVDNAVAITINTQYVSVIKELSHVKSVCLSETYSKPETVDMGAYAQASEEDMDEALKNASRTANEVTNKTSVYKTGVYDSSSVMEEYGYKGQGSVVAIIDTGLDYTHNAFIWDDEHSSVYALDTTNFNKNTVATALANKNLLAEERSSLNGQQISVNDVYISEKVPFAYDYADNDTDVYPSSSNHGTHVAGIVAGYDPSGYVDKDGNEVNEPFVGVAPSAQLVICKVFTDDLDDPEAGGADTEDILAALEDCILLGVDVINMSLGTSCGFSTTDDGDEEGEMLNEVYNAVKDAGISLVCAASNDYSAAYGGTFGTNLAINPDSGTVGSPSVFAAALSVASISGQKSPYMIANGETVVYYEESSDQYNKYYDFSEMILEGRGDSATFEYVVVPNYGNAADYNRVRNLITGRIALVKRGDITFNEKVKAAERAGAIGIIVYNNVSGTVRMALGELNDPIPSCCISMELGATLVAAANRSVGSITVDKNLSAGPFMSEFSSWGGTPDLKLKPEVTAHGGEITSAVPGGYGEQSGTSMASPNMAGVVSIIRSYLKSTQSDLVDDTNALTQRINQLVMSTATLVKDRDNLPYSPRKQGAGLGSLENAISTRAYLFTDDESIDYRPKVNLLDDPDKVGVYKVEFKIKNFGDGALTFNLNPIFMTEKLAINGLAVAEQAHILDDVAPTWTLNGVAQTSNVLVVESGAEATVAVTLTLSDAEKNYIDTSFANGMYVEGFINLVSATEGQCDLNLPFLGFYGDWSAIPMLDYDAYYVDEAAQDTSIKDEDKPQASTWATQPYTTYYNDNYSMPMGSFAYLQDENADKVYTTMEHNAVSCYDNYYGDDDPENYLTTYEFRGLYVGLMRGARKVDYQLVNDATGEILYESTAYRINKAYSGGGSAVPGFIKFELNPLEYGFVSNGKYRMDFQFYCDYGDKDRTEPDSTFTFTFYADYEAPSLRDVRVRYQDYKEDNQTKQRIYLDMDVYDNHYTMAALLCYYDGEELNQVTDYVVPFYDCEKNSTNTVSIDITDIYEQYGSMLFVQFDDYALNHAIYQISLSTAEAGVTPDTFELAEGEDKISLDIYETHKVSLVYGGDANLSNFTWESSNRSVADVKNGEIVGLKAGVAKMTVSNGRGYYKSIEVTVSNNEKKLSLPSISFATIVNSEDKLSSDSTVSLYPDQDVTLTINTDPWYYPKETLKIKWSSTDSSIVSVDENGKLDVIKKGTASINAVVLKEDGSESPFTASITIDALDPFVISGYALSKYRGKDKLVEIPDDKMIMYISEDAFEDNSTMEELIIPKTVINIYEGAFRNCTALKNVYLVEKTATAIPDADLKIIYRSAFEGCTALEKVDLTNVKVITLGANAMKNCSSLKEIVNMKAIGTAFSNAFEGCKSLASADLSGMQVAGSQVFLNCTKLKTVTTGTFTDIGDYMFEGCTALASIELNNTVVGKGAFTGCSNLKNVKVNGVKGESFVIENAAFYNSGLKSITFGDDCIVRKIGDMAFAKTKLTSIVLPEGLTEIGASAFSGTITFKKITLPASFSYDQITLAGAFLNGYEVDIKDGSAYAIEDGILYSSDKTVLYSVYGSSITSVTIPETVQTIYDYAFSGTAITSIIIPASVTEIGVGAFKDSALSSITIEGESLAGIAADTFNGTNLTTIALPASVTKIGSYAFANTLLINIDLSNVISIESYAFSNCLQLKNVTTTAALNSVGDYVFEGCASIDTITFHAVEVMGEGVFANSGVKTVIFGDETTTMGTYTFASPRTRIVMVEGEAINANVYNFAGLKNLKKVVIGSGITTIPDYAFYNCTALEEVDLGGVVEIEDFAFAGCKKLATINLGKVKTIGEMAFYNCKSLGEVALSSARTIGAGAFAMYGDVGGVTSLSIPVAVAIGYSAFEGTSITTVTLPSTLGELGYGVFAYAMNLAEIKVAEDSTKFFVRDGALYKDLGNGSYELMAFPAAHAIESSTFTIIDNTIRVDASAFAGIGLNKTAEDDAITHVVFPYTLTNIGDGAFYESGITEYTFTSLNAPVLETFYNEEAEEIMTKYGTLMTNPAINSFYYSNFNTLFVHYVDTVTSSTGEVSTMIIHRPVNGVGYDNYVYAQYFGTVDKTAVVKDATTLAFLEQMTKFDDYTSDAIATWTNMANSGNTTLYAQEVKDFADIVKEARRLYSGIKDADQLAFIDPALVTLLETRETEMRAVKAAYNIPVTLKYILAEEGSYKYEYNEYETFDMTGIVVNRYYDDGSVERVDNSKLQLVTTTELRNWELTVKILDTETGTEFNVGIIVNEGSKGTVDGDGTVDNSKSLSGGMIALIVVTSVLGAGLIAGAIAFVLIRKKKSATQKAESTYEIVTESVESESESAEENSETVENAEENVDNASDSADEEKESAERVEEKSENEEKEESVEETATSDEETENTVEEEKQNNEDENSSSGKDGDIEE